MSSTAFQRLQLALERIASAPRRVAAPASLPLRTTLEGLTVVYELNDAERTLTVVDILRVGSEEIL